MNTGSIRPGKGRSNTLIEFDLRNQEGAPEDVAVLVIEVSGRLDSTNVTRITVSDVYEEDLRAMAKLFTEMADMYKMP
jgi:hypothetical protein